MKVYPAGAISGLTFADAVDWREKIRDAVPVHINTLSPLRGKYYLQDLIKHDKIDGSYDEFPLSSARGINTRDHWDVMRCDVVFVNLLGTTKVSIGTVMEIAWAHAYRKPVILVIEEENIHSHPMIDECVGFVVDSLEKGIQTLIAIASTDHQLTSPIYP